jgi:hypothetical protein
VQWLALRAVVVAAADIGDTKNGILS